MEVVAAVAVHVPMTAVVVDILKKISMKTLCKIKHLVTLFRYLTKHKKTKVFKTQKL